MPKFITRQDVTPASGSWQTIDVTSYVGTDAGSVAGVLLKTEHIENVIDRIITINSILPINNKYTR